MTDNRENEQGFSEAWLTLREPADHAARSQRLTTQLSNWPRQHGSINCVELGAGTGSNLRYLCPLLGHDQQWTLIDNDPTLLNRLPGLIITWAERNHISALLTDDELQLTCEHFSARIGWTQQDLAQRLTSLSFENTQLVCASALLDLTSAHWLKHLASMCVANHCATLFALNYNGHIDWSDGIAEDKIMQNLLNAHQLGDKGFGKALGPQAVCYFAQLLEDKGRHVATDESSWIIDASMSALQRALIDGWAPAAKEQDKEMSAVVDQWKTQRLTACQSNRSILTVGHTDLLSLPD